MFCPACGAEVVKEAVYCHRCGERITPDENDPPRNSNSAKTPKDAFESSLSNRRNNDNDSGNQERELWRGGYSSKAMIGAWATSAVISLLLLVAAVLWASDVAAWLVLLGLMLLPWLYNAAVLAYRRMSVRYTLTSQRFIHESGILRRVSDRIEALDMDDIACEQGLLERLVGVGTIRIVSTDRSHPDLALRGIENVRNVAEMFDDARRAERRRHGLHVEQI